MGYARPLGQTVSVRQRDLANTHGVCGCVALIQRGILREDFSLGRHPIGRLSISNLSRRVTISIRNCTRR